MRARTGNQGYWICGDITLDLDFYLREYYVTAVGRKDRHNAFEHAYATGAIAALLPYTDWYVIETVNREMSRVILERTKYVDRTTA